MLTSHFLMISCHLLLNLLLLHSLHLGLISFKLLLLISIPRLNSWWVSCLPNHLIVSTFIRRWTFLGWSFLDLKTRSDAAMSRISSSNWPILVISSFFVLKNLSFISLTRLICLSVINLWSLRRIGLAITIANTLSILSRLISFRETVHLFNSLSLQVLSPVIVDLLFQARLHSLVLLRNPPWR